MKKYKTIALALATLFLAGCATNTAKPSPTSAATTSGAYTTPSASQMTTTAQIPITSEPVVTTADLVVTTASNEVPSTSEEPTITDAPSETTAPIITTKAPVTTEVPSNTSNILPIVTEKPAETTTTKAPTTTAVPATTTTKAPTTTKTPSTTTNAPIITPVTTTKAPTTTKTPETTTKVPVTTTTKTPSTTTTKAPATTTTKAPTTTTTKAPTTTTAPHTHSYGAWKTTKAATCTADGTQTRTCSCGARETKTIVATGHSYGAWKTTKAATCTATGTQIRTCSCGASETKTISAIGHNWSAWTVTKAATESAKGEEVRSCSVCGKKETRSIDKLAHTHSYGEWTLCDDYIHESRSCSCGETETQIHYATPEDARLIADRVIYYVNQYRVEEGNQAATKLDRLTLVAEYRSEQLTTNFAHDTEDSREAYGYYEYGDHIITEETRLDPDTFEIIYTGNILDYYRPVGQEAIYVCYGRTIATIDSIAKGAADGLRGSSGHWAYVGAVSGHYTTYNYIAVGMAYCASNEYSGGDDAYKGMTYHDNWFCCVLVSNTNEYE